MPPSFLHAGSLALEHDRHGDGQLLVHGDALQIDVHQRTFDGLVLPVDNHCLGALAAFQSQIKNRVVAGLRSEESASPAADQR